MVLLADLNQQATGANALLVLFVGLGFALVAFWIWMSVDCLAYENDGNLRTVWLLVLLFGGWPGALFYFFLRRRQRLHLAGLGPAAGWQCQPPPMPMPVAVMPPAKPLAAPAKSAAWGLGTLVAVLLAVVAVPGILLVVGCAGLFVVYWHMLEESKAKLVAENEAILAAMQRAELPPPTAVAAAEQAAPSLPLPGLPVADGDALAAGDELLCEWAGQWHRVQVLELLVGGNVKIHWIGWSDGFDEVVPRSRLRRMPAEPVAEQPELIAN
jgi:hypothetical protein